MASARMALAISVEVEGTATALVDSAMAKMGRLAENPNSKAREGMGWFALGLHWPEAFPFMPRPEAVAFARHKQSTGLFVSGLSPPPLRGSPFYFRESPPASATLEPWCAEKDGGVWRGWRFPSA